MPENMQEVLMDIRERVVRMETKLDDFAVVRDKADKAYNIAQIAKEKVEKLENNHVEIKRIEKLEETHVESKRVDKLEADHVPKERIEKIENSQTWVWRTFISALIVSVVTWFMSFKIRKEKSMIDVLLDAGHGGIDSGAVGKSGLKEKDVNLKLAFKIGKLLQDRGVKLAYTRTTDILLGKTINEDLVERVKISNKDIKPKYFVSIHNNSFTPSANGSETYVIGFGGNAEKLARNVQTNLIAETGLYNRGVKTANFYVLKHTDCPAILVEVAFLSNIHEELLLRNDDFLNKAATGIAKGICIQLGMKWNIDIPKPLPQNSISWQWALSKGLVKQENKTKEVENAVEVLYNLNKVPVVPVVPTPTPTPILRPNKYEVIGTTHVVRLNPMKPKIQEMVLKTGNALAKTESNFVNGALFLRNPDKTIKGSIGWLVSEGKVLAERHEDLDFGWKGNAKGSFIVYKDGTVFSGWRWDSEMRKEIDRIWFCVQGFNLYPPNMTVKQGLVAEGYAYGSVGFAANRLSMGYNGKDIVIAARPNSDAERSQLTMDNLGCKNNSICLDSNSTMNMVVNGQKIITTDVPLCSIITF